MCQNTKSYSLPRQIYGKKKVSKARAQDNDRKKSP